MRNFKKIIIQNSYGFISAMNVHRLRKRDFDMPGIFLAFLGNHTDALWFWNFIGV